MKLLIVEDNHFLAAELYEFLEGRGHQMDAAPDGITGLHLAVVDDYDAVVLDSMLPRMDGPQMLAKIKQTKPDLPVVMLTARSDVSDKLECFASGADDYIVKPVDPLELEARLLAVARRRDRVQVEQRLQVGDLLLDLRQFEAWRAGRPCRLGPSMYTLLACLMRASPSVVTRRQLEGALWGGELPHGASVRSRIYDLRKCVEFPDLPPLIHTVGRFGYRMVGVESQV